MDARAAIVGGGITGLATAAWLEHDHGVRDLVVLEADDRPGGKIRTRIEDNHCLEWGPQGFLDTAPDTLELVHLVELEDSLVRADDASADRFIVRGGIPRRVPLNPIAFLGSDVLPLLGRLRVLAEPFARGRPDAEETVFEFAQRRIGRTAAEVLVDAMVTGVFAGNSRQLSLTATFPRMAAMEAEHGSLTRALMARMRAARGEGRSSSGPAGPGGTLTTFRAGMAELPRTLSARLGDRLLASRPVESLQSAGGRFHLSAPGVDVTAEAVLLATPAGETARLMAPVASDATAPLQQICTAPIAVVMTSYSDPLAFGRPIHGFGFLVPGSEPLDILGTLYCHSIFPGQAPPDRLFLRTMVGGARDPGAVDLDDEALLFRTRNALNTVLGADPEPDGVWVVRWREGITQYTLGHLDRVEAVEAAARSAGVELAGSPYRGVSVNDCIRQARDVAARIVERLS
jgi:oxygen-dependent protoporphyrinogen oxidase